jgi:serine protease Do
MNRDPNGTTPPRRYYLGAVALLLAGLIIGLGLSAGFNLQWASNAQRPAAAALSTSAAAPESPFVPVVERCLPAVVFVDVRKKATSQDEQGDDPQMELFRRFFGDQRQPRSVPSSGSGFIIDPEGHILTNNHVVSNASEITVTLNDRRTFKAKVVGTDPESDVAVIKIDGDKLPYLELGDSDKLRVGDWAIAIGNPLGMLRGSVTVGIISAQGRTNLNIFGGTPDFQDFIQTDASINFGNSGGPLCNIRGEVIGINTAINPSGQGIGFAIPINMAKHVADQLVSHGHVQRAWLGVSLDQVTPEMAEGLGLDVKDGVIITKVTPGFPADKAGLRRNDVIVEYEGQPVSDMQKFRLRVADTSPGKVTSMVVIRDGKRIPVRVTLGERTPEAMAAAQQNGGQAKETPASPDAGPASAQTLGGIAVRNMTEDELSQAGVKSGVLVTQVAEGSAADDAGIQADDVIEEVGGKPASSAVEFRRLMQAAKTRSSKGNAILLVNRQGNTRFVAVKLAL